MISQSIPACKDCKHFQESADEIFSECTLYHYETFDYINGTVTKQNPLALICRAKENRCGREGKNFEQWEIVEEEEDISFWEYFKGFFTKSWMF
jgi:hypothetical protein